MQSYVFLRSGDSVRLEKGGEGEPSLYASKSNSPENTYLFDFFTLHRKIQKNFNLRTIAGLEADSFMRSLDKKYAGLDSFLLAVDSNTEVDVYFKKAMETRLKAIRGKDILSYKSYYNYLKKGEPQVPENFYAFLDDKFYDHPSLLLFQEGQSFGSQLNAKDLGFTKFPGAMEYYAAILAEAKEVFSVPILQHYYQYMALESQINFGSGLDGADPMIATYTSEVTNDFLLKSLAATIKPWEAIRKGMLAPDFSGMNRKGQKVNLSELKGKSVYVDVWATWCGPCIKEIPALKQLEKDLHGGNVKFVSISIDEEKNKEKWLKFIEKEALGGTQLMAKGAWNSWVAQAYNIQGIPRFLLIDAEGKIVSANAPRPSSTEAKELIESNS